MVFSFFDCAGTSARGSLNDTTDWLEAIIKKKKGRQSLLITAPTKHSILKQLLINWDVLILVCGFLCTDLPVLFYLTTSQLYILQRSSGTCCVVECW